MGLWVKFKRWGCLQLLKLHKWMLSRPLILSFTLSSSTILFSFILVFLGDKIPDPFKLTKFDSEDHLRLTVLGMSLSIVSLVWTFLLEASEKYFEYKKEEDISNAEAVNYIRERVDTRIVTVCNNKYNTLISLIDNIANGKTTPKCIISRPCDQLKTITKELVACLRSLLAHQKYYLNENDMYISIFYKFRSDNVWNQTHSAFPETGESIEYITKNTNSTFNHTLKSKNGFIFINDKQLGKELGQYIPDKDDKYDQNGKLKGSILCYRIICKKNGIDYITAVISISTYNKKIEPSNLPNLVKNTGDNICNYIISAFEKRIRVELCLLYLSNLYEKKSKKATVVKSPKISNNTTNVASVTNTKSKSKEQEN